MAAHFRWNIQHQSNWFCNWAALTYFNYQHKYCTHKVSVLHVVGVIKPLQIKTWWTYKNQIMFWGNTSLLIWFKTITAFKAHQTDQTRAVQTLIYYINKHNRPIKQYKQYNYPTSAALCGMFSDVSFSRRSAIALVACCCIT